MKKILIFSILFISTYSVLTFNAQALEIKFGINSNNFAPLLYQFENPNLATGGFIYEIFIAIAEDMKLDYSVITLPKRRMTKELKSGNIDLTCHSNRHWDFEHEDEFSWSKPIFLYTNVLVAVKDINFKNADQITGITLGTVENYSYRDLNANFENKKILRQDATSVSESVKKLIGKRLDYIIMSEIEFYYYKKIYPELKRSSFSLDKTEIQCALNRKSSLKLDKLNKSIEQLKSKKVFNQIFNRYTHSKKRPNILVYGLNDSNSPPFLFSDSSTKPTTIHGGIFFGLALEVGRELKRPLHFVALPRNRLDAALSEGPVELICYNAEIWAGDYAKDHLWSIPIFKQTNVIVSNRIITGSEKIKSLKDLKGKTIGTTLGFVYPALDSYFKEGSIIRDDGVSGSINVSKLNAQRVSYIIMNNLEFDYYKKKIPDLVRAPFEFDSVAVKCALSKKSDLKIQELNAALLALKKSGKLNKIFFGRLQYMP